MPVRIELHFKGFTELLNSPEVIADMQRRLEAIAAAAGEGFEVSPARAGGRRARGAVYAATEQAKLAEATGAALTRSIDAGRG